MSRRTPRGYHPVILIVPHSPLCGALAKRVTAWSRGAIRHGWDADPVKWDLSGRRNDRARHSWLVCRCNGAGCHAEVAIYWQHIHSRCGLDLGPFVQPGGIAE